MRASSSGSESGVNVRSTWPLAGLMLAMVMVPICLSFWSGSVQSERSSYYAPMLAIQTLLRSSIDYAGLFPPAGLDMQTAVDNYALYRASPDAWALARFILPAGRLSEFEVAAARHLSSAQSWRLSALAGPDLSA